MGGESHKRTFSEVMSTRDQLKDSGLLTKYVFDTTLVPEDETWGQTKARILSKGSDQLCSDSDWLGETPFNLYWEMKNLASHENEDVLHEKKIVYVGCATREQELQEKLQRKKIECKIKRPHCGDRADSISLVLGPSGSGKTTFCVNESIHSSRREFRVYMYSHSLKDDSDDDDDDDDTVEKRCLKLQNILAAEIKHALKLGTDGVALKKLNMNLYVIIDEAGSDEFYSTPPNLIQLRNVVQTFATNGQLVVSGTGLDLVTTNIGSSGEGILKIRLLPWELKDFAKLAKNQTIVNLAAKHDVYTKLVSNARAAARLLHWLEVTKNWGNNDDNVAYVVRAVSYEYIQGNGLKDVDQNARRQIVRAVLRLLDRCEYDVPMKPVFDEGLTKEVLNKARSLIDVNVEKKGQGEELSLNEGHCYAVSVTPAITVVLAALLRNTATLQSCWSGFESILALEELFKLVREETADQMPAFEIVKLDKPYDVRIGMKTMQVPEMSHSSVLINGPKASYADVIAPFRLLQAKHCESSSGVANLFLEAELKKMGLLKGSTQAQKVFAVEQYEIWVKAEMEKDNASVKTAPTPATAVPDAKRPSTGQSQQQSTQSGQLCRRGLYPASLLVSEAAKKKPACRQFKLHDKGAEGEEWIRMKDRKDDAGSDDAHGIGKTAEVTIVRNKPTTVVFATNGAVFNICGRVDDCGSDQSLRTISRSCVLLEEERALKGHPRTKTQIEILLTEKLVAGVTVELAFARS